MNNVSLIGRLAADATIRVARTKGKDEITIANFRLAVSRIGSDDADFISCTAFGKTAEFIRDYLSRGSRIGVTGRIQTGSYEKDGTTIYTTDVIVDRVDFADGKKEDDSRSSRGRRR